LSSEIPVAVLAFNFRGPIFASLPITSLTFPTPVPVQPLFPGTIPPPGIPGGSIGPATTITIGVNALVFGQVAAGGGWSTLISIGNTSDGTQIVRIDFFGSHGLRVQSRVNVVIPPRVVVFFSTDSLVTAVE